jgi:colanic acid/amylovoran biosynthesis glycosyltransferase
MRITFCHSETEYLCDAQSIFLQRLMPALRQLGHELRLLLIAPRDPKACALYKFCRANAIAIDATFSRGSMGNNVRWCVRKLRENRPDVFVPHHCYWALYASAWLRKSGVPCVGVLHSDDQPTKQLMRLFAQPGSPFTLTGFVAVSDVIRSQLVEVNPGLPAAVIPCGVPLPESPVSPPAGVLRVAYFGRFVQEQKRIADLAVAFARVATQGAGVECHVWGAGHDEDLMRRALASEPSGGLVVVHGAIPAGEIYRRMREHHVIVLLSDYEGTPTSIMEGMANGLVPVVLDIGGGVGDLVKHMQTGLLVRDRERDFEHAIGRLRADAPLWARLSTDAAAHVRANYSVESCAHRWSRFCEMLTATAGWPQAIRVPLHVGIPKTSQVDGQKYYSAPLDVLANLYSVARRGMSMCTFPR